MPFTLQVQRVEPVNLDAINENVLTLMEIAEENGGTYDGWECPVTTGD
jgi:hypothetical protein